MLNQKRWLIGHLKRNMKNDVTHLDCNHRVWKEALHTMMLPISPSLHHCCNRITWCKTLHCGRNHEMCMLQSFTDHGWRGLLNDEWKMYFMRVIKLPRWMDVGHGPHGPHGYMMPWWMGLLAICMIWPWRMSRQLNATTWCSTLTTRKCGAPPRAETCRLQAGQGRGCRGPNASV